MAVKVNLELSGLLSLNTLLQNKAAQTALHFS